MRLIDADAFEQMLIDAQDTCKKRGGNVLYGFLGKVRANLESFPTALEIVRCKDCKHSEHWYSDKRRCFLWHETGIDVFEDGFCNYGERRSE